MVGDKDVRYMALHGGGLAKAVETYTKAARESLEAQNQAAEIKVRAERKAGELIARMEKAKGKRTDKRMALSFC